MPTDEEWRAMAKSFGGVGNDSADNGKAAYAALLSGGTSGFNAVLGGNRDLDGHYARAAAHGIYWTTSETDAGTAVLYNFGRGSAALFREPTGDKRLAVSVRCIRN